MSSARNRATTTAMGEITVTWCAGQDDPTGMMASDDLIELEEEFA